MSDIDKTTNDKIEGVKGSQNYDSWSLDLACLLMSMGVDTCLKLDPPTLTTTASNAAEVHKNKLA